VDGAAPEARIAACSEVVESRAYAGKDLAFAYNNRGVPHYQKHDFDVAIVDFGESIRLDPGNASYFGSRALAYVAKHDHARAAADYTEVLRLSPDDAAAYFSRGNSFSARGDDANAIADYGDAIRIDPTPPS
jgi:tetratricopeptide (TPR) repeat protein